MSTDQPSTPGNKSPETGVTINEIYKEQYAHFRGMNDILYKIPPLFTAVIGALWYFAVQNITTDRWIARAVFLFTAIACISFVNVMARFRQSFSGYIDNLNKMDGDMKVTTKDGAFRWSTITTIQFLLWAAATVSVLGIAYSFAK
jgi:hypothetical protein